MSAAAYAVVVLWLTFTAFSNGHTDIIVCPSRLFYGLVCPGCGTTRATLLFLKGHIWEAASTNPNVLLSVGFVVGYPVLMLLELLLRKPLLPRLCHLGEKALHDKRILAFIICIEATVWLRNIYLSA